MSSIGHNATEKGMTDEILQDILHKKRYPSVYDVKNGFVSPSFLILRGIKV